jgi:hypothetical protein
MGVQDQGGVAISGFRRVPLTVPPLQKFAGVTRSVSASMLSRLCRRIGGRFERRRTLQTTARWRTVWPRMKRLHPESKRFLGDLGTVVRMQNWHK